MRGMGKRAILVIVMILNWAMLPGCDVFWLPPVPTDDEWQRGLVVLYPGDFNSDFEMAGFYNGLRAGGVDQAIEISHWSAPMESCFERDKFWEDFPGWAEQEARRLADYQVNHPGAPVTLLGFSGGGLAAIKVAEQMPPGTMVDRVLLLSAGVSPDYDLTAMLEKVRDRVIVYWSPREAQLGALLLQWLGTVDGNFEEAAAISGFSHVDEKLVQIEWSEEMAAFGNYGDHLDYFMNVPWISEYVASWVAPSAPPAQP